MKKIKITINGNKDGSTGLENEVMNKTMESLNISIIPQYGEAEVIEQQRVVFVELTEEPPRHIIDLLYNSLDVSGVDYKVEFINN